MVSPWSREYAEAHGPWTAENVEAPTPDTSMPAKAGPAPAPPTDPTAHRRRHPSDDRPAQRRGAAPVVAVAAAVGLVATAVVVGVIRSDDGDPGRTATATTFEAVERVDAIPAATVAPAEPPAVATTAPGPTLGAPLATVPEAVLVGSSFATVPGVEADDLIAYDLAAAAAANASVEQPMRTMYKISGLVGAGDRPTIVSVTAAHDPRAQRDSLSVTSGASNSDTITDRAGGTVFRSSPALPPGTWAQFAVSEVLEGTNAVDLAELFDAFAIGPITPELLAVAKIRPDHQLVRLGAGTTARRFDVIVDPSWIRPWGAMAFAASPESVVSGRSGDSAITFEVYVTAEPLIALVTSQFEVDGEARGLSQFFERRPADVEIDVPDAAAVIGSGA